MALDVIFILSLIVILDGLLYIKNKIRKQKTKNKSFILNDKRSFVFISGCFIFIISSLFKIGNVIWVVSQIN